MHPITCCCARCCPKLTKAEFRQWLINSKTDVLVDNYSIEPCDCGDVNCKGWRLVAAAVVLLALLVAAPASAQTPIRDFLYRTSQVTAIGAHGADGFSTEFALAKGAFHEANPALLRITTRPAWFGAYDMSAAALSLWITDKIPNRTIGTIANFAMTGFFAGVAVHNTRAIARVERSSSR